MVLYDKVWSRVTKLRSANGRTVPVIGVFNATDARASIADDNIPTSGLGFSPGRRRGSQMTTVHRSVGTGTSGGLQVPSPRHTYSYPDRKKLT